MNRFIDQIIHGDCLELLPQLPDDSIHCMISDIPYGINHDDWDVFYSNTNRSLLGQSPAQAGKQGFRRRGKPLNGWNRADRELPRQYQAWCSRWAEQVYPKMKDGSSLFIFGARRTLHRALVALEDNGFILRDILAWEKPSAHHRAQKISGVLNRRGLYTEAQNWQGWRLGSLAPRWEPIAWLFKPYPDTLTDTVLRNQVGAINVDAVLVDGKIPSNKLTHWYESDEPRVHGAQKPVQLLEFLVKLTTREDQIILDPFIGSGSTAIACKRQQRHYVGFEIKEPYVVLAQQRLADAAR